MSEKISQMTSGNPAQTSDLIPIARSGANYAVTAASIAALGTSPWENWLGSNFSGMTGGSFVFTSCNFGLAMGGFNSARQSGGSPTATQLLTIIVQPSSLSSSGGLIDGVFNITGGLLQQWFTKVGLAGTTDARFWFGVSDQNSSGAPTAFFSDTPSVNFIGFRFSTNAGDTHYQAVCCNTSAVTVVDTGIVPTSTPQILKIAPSGSSMQFYINGSLVATISTDVPASSVPLASILTCDNLNSSSSNTEFAGCYVYAQLTS